jgi:hypothetical protein
VRALAIRCVVRRWESCACSGVVEAGEVEQRARQMIGGRKGGGGSMHVGRYGLAAVAGLKLTMTFCNYLKILNKFELI